MNAEPIPGAILLRFAIFNWNLELFNSERHIRARWFWNRNDVCINNNKFIVADPDPGSGAFLTPSSGIRDGIKKQDPDPGWTTWIILPRAQKKNIF